jgi:hypothetical protein
MQHVGYFVWNFFDRSGKISMRKKLTHALVDVRAILPQVAEREVQQLTGNWPNDSPSLQTKSLSILWTDVVVKRPYRAMK